MSGVLRQERLSPFAATRAANQLRMNALVSEQYAPAGRQPAYLSAEWFRAITPKHGDRCDYRRMVQIMVLREQARRSRDIGDWEALTDRAEQLLTDRRWPRSA